MHLRVGAELRDDAEHVAALTRNLRQSLDQLDGQSVAPAPANAPAGAKGAGMDLAQLVVTFTGGLPVLVGMVRSWRARNRDAEVTIELEGDVLTLRGADRETESRLVDAFLSRHAVP
jgi:hypothetical protein